jgi:cytoskeletal protein CcmA (bactofilin family)
MKYLSALLLSLFSLLVYSFVLPPALAADLHSGESVSITKPLNNPYLAGQSIEVTAPVANDVVAAGGTITVDTHVGGNVLAAGGTIDVRGSVDHSVRAAGGTITIDSSVGQDVVVFGGNIMLSKQASVSGDVIFSGGRLQINGPVKGTIHLNGGSVTINAPIGGNVEGNVHELTLGPQAVINGDLTYQSDNKASIQSGATVHGKVSYKQAPQNEHAKRGLAALFTLGTLYKLIGEIIIGLLLLWILRPFSLRLFAETSEAPLRNIVLGFATLILLPIAGVILLLLFWLGLATLIFYVFLLLLTMVFLPLFVGWKIMDWWEHRDKRVYAIDWKAAVLGPIVLLILSVIPIIGWLIAFILFLWILGGIVHYLPSIADVPASAGTTPTTERKPATRRRK